jgi:5'-methylthioadenosine phosphorylase
LVIGLIGGSGVYDPSIIVEPEDRTVVTPFGDVEVIKGSVAGVEVIFMQRHGAGHTVPPHNINYRANVWAMWHEGATRVLTTSAVGSLNLEMPPGSFVLADQFIDFTKNRVCTFFDGGKYGLAHVDFTEPYCPEMRRFVSASALSLGMPCKNGATYVCFDGPRYETPAEIRAVRILGADLVGMTNVPEVTLARELGLCYATICMVTNWAAGMAGEKLSHEEVLSVMAANSKNLLGLLRAAIPGLGKLECAGCGGPIGSLGPDRRR